MPGPAAEQAPGHVQAQARMVVLHHCAHDLAAFGASDDLDRTFPGSIRYGCFEQHWPRALDLKLIAPEARLSGVQGLRAPERRADHDSDARLRRQSATAHREGFIKLSVAPMGRETSSRFNNHDAASTGTANR